MKESAKIQEAPRTIKTGDHQPLVSIVTPSLNQGRFIERTIRSVLAQDYPRIEYIVVDGMSDDETAGILQKYEPHITKVIREPDTGQANAINKGFQAANGEILAWLNSDDCYVSGSAVSEAVSHLRSQSFDLVYGRRKYINAEGFHVFKVRPFRDFSYDALKLWNFMPQECCFWTSQMYERAGGFVDETYEVAMDYELWMRLLKNEARILAVNQFVGLYRIHAETKSIAKWQSTGLKEVARVQEQYCDRTLNPLEMHLASVDYYTGVKFSNHPLLRQIRNAIWSGIEKATIVTGNRLASLDSWTYHNEIKLLERASEGIT